MKILLIGSGAREHALAKALVIPAKAGIQPSRAGALDPRLRGDDRRAVLYNIGTQINPGISKLVEEIAVIPFTDPAKIVAWAQAKEVDFAIIGPEKPLELGLADALWAVGIPVIGPTQKLAQIESSKGFARDLMQKYQIAGLPRYQRFPHYNAAAKAFLESLDGQYVVKADGLMSGKGVKVAGDHLHSLQDAIDFCEEINGPFVIEEKLVGPEFSLLSFSDGQHLAHMPAVQDHKRLLEGDQGPNTGGMGTITFANHRLPCLTEADIAEAQAINESIIAALLEETGEYYRGILYGGFMKTASGIKVIEYNARFGDPESINLLGLLATDFIDICAAIILGQLDQLEVNFKAQASVCKYLVPKGYPDVAEKGGVVDVSKVQDQDALYYASIESQDGHLKMLGSRALAVLCMDEDIAKAEAAVEAIIASIDGDFYYRRDIGKLKP